MKEQLRDRKQKEYEMDKLYWKLKGRKEEGNK
jgi:hypothetical protein